MPEKVLQAEIDAAYKSLDKADKQIKSLLIERRQHQIVIDMLETAGFIKEGKLQEAIEFSQTFYS